MLFLLLPSEDDSVTLSDPRNLLILLSPLLLLADRGVDEIGFMRINSIQGNTLKQRGIWQTESKSGYRRQKRYEFVNQLFTDA